MLLVHGFTKSNHGEIGDRLYVSLTLFLSDNRGYSKTVCPYRKATTILMNSSGEINPCSWCTTVTSYSSTIAPCYVGTTTTLTHNWHWYSTVNRLSFDKNTFSINCRVNVFLLTTPHRWCQPWYKENNPNYGYGRFKQNEHFAHELIMHCGVFLASCSWSDLCLHRSNYIMQKWLTKEIRATLRDIMRWWIVSPLVEENRRTGLFISPSGIKTSFHTWQLRQSGSVGLR